MENTNQNEPTEERGMVYLLTMHRLEQMEWNVVQLLCRQPTIFVVQIAVATVYGWGTLPRALSQRQVWICGLRPRYQIIPSNVKPYTHTPIINHTLRDTINL